MTLLPPRQEAAFTLIEVLGAFFMTTIVLVLVSGIFVQNGRQREAATELLRVETTASAALDILSRDLEASVYLSRPEAQSSGDHAWIFLAEGSGELGATRFRFQTQNVSRENLAENASTWVDVAYFLTEQRRDIDDGDAFDGDRYTLWRWRSTRPPNDAARTFPDEDDIGSARVIEGIADFGVTFIDSEGESLDEWDSTLSTGSAPLPSSAEIRLVIYKNAREGEAAPGILQIPGRVHERHVSLAMPQPIDLAALVALETSDQGPNCFTIANCAEIDDEWFVEQLDDECGGDEDLCDLLEQSQSTCWDEIVNEWPSVAGLAPAECEDRP
jgi:hypothetical protein